MTEETSTICFIGTAKQKALLERWAKEDDRSVSYIMRQILERESQRREPVQILQKPKQQTTH